MGRRRAAVANVVDALAPAADNQHGAVAGPIMGTLLTVGGIAAFAGLLRRRPWAPVLALVVGVGPSPGSPCSTRCRSHRCDRALLGEHGSATAGQVATLVVIVVVAVWLTVAAWAEVRTGSGREQRTLTPGSRDARSLYTLALLSVPSPGDGARRAGSVRRRPVGGEGVGGQCSGEGHQAGGGLQGLVEGSFRRAGGPATGPAR